MLEPRTQKQLDSISQPLIDYWDSLNSNKRSLLISLSETAPNVLYAILNGHRKAGVTVIYRLMGVDTNITIQMCRPEAHINKKTSDISFSEFWKSLSSDEKQELALKSGKGYMSIAHLATGFRLAGIESISDLCRADKRISPEMLRPDLFPPKVVTRRSRSKERKLYRETLRGE